MMLNRKLTGGLAWAGLILVLAVPSAEILSAKGDPKANAVDPVQTASISETASAVDELLANGKPMPDYISDGAAPRVVLPAPGVTLPAAPKAAATPKPQPTKPSVQTAALQPAPATTPPTPMPATMRPKTAPVAEAPLVLDGGEVMSREASTPLPAQPQSVDEPRYVSEEELEDWDSGSLADYLERRGLISDASYSDEGADSSATFEEDDGEFFVNEGRRPPRNVGNDDSFIVFPFVGN